MLKSYTDYQAKQAEHKAFLEAKRKECEEQAAKEEEAKKKLEEDAQEKANEEPKEETKEQPKEGGEGTTSSAVKDQENLQPQNINNEDRADEQTTKPAIVISGAEETTAQPAFPEAVDQQGQGPAT